MTIVGVAGTINSIDLGQPVTKERVYRPATQQPPAAMALVLKTGLDPQTLVSQVRGGGPRDRSRTAARRRPHDGAVGVAIARTAA